MLMEQPFVVCRLIWLPVSAVLTASRTSISPLLGQTEASVVQRAGLGGKLVDSDIGIVDGDAVIYHVPHP